MLKNKRSRSQSWDALPYKRPKAESSPQLNIKPFLDILAKVTCAFCNKDITKSIKVVCSVCKDWTFCLDCLILNKSKDSEHEHRHDYHIVDKLSFPIFTKDWNAYEEVQLLSGNFPRFNIFSHRKIWIR